MWFANANCDVTWFFKLVLERNENKGLYTIQQKYTPKKITGVWARTNKNKQTNTFSTIMNLSTYRVCLSYFRSIHDKTSDSYDTVL